MKGKQIKSIIKEAISSIKLKNNLNEQVPSDPCNSDVFLSLAPNQCQNGNTLAANLAFSGPNDDYITNAANMVNYMTEIFTAFG